MIYHFTASPSFLPYAPVPSFLPFPFPVCPLTMPVLCPLCGIHVPDSSTRPSLSSHPFSLPFIPSSLPSCPFMSFTTFLTLLSFPVLLFSFQLLCYLPRARVFVALVFVSRSLPFSVRPFPVLAFLSWLQVRSRNKRKTQRKLIK